MTASPTATQEFARHGKDVARFLAAPPKLQDTGHRPRYLHVAAGDIVLAHNQLPHVVTANHSSQTRYALYFRVRHACVPRSLHLGSLFYEWEGLHALLPPTAGRFSPFGQQAVQLRARRIVALYYRSSTLYQIH